MEGVASVLGIAGFGLQLYQTLKTFANKWADAHQYLLWLMTDVDLSVSAIRGVQDLLDRDDEIRKRGQGRRLFNERSVIDARRAADQCMVIFRNVVDFILKKGKAGKEEVVLDDKHPDYLYLNQKVILSSLGRINWALAQEDVERLTNRLTTFKITLNILILVVSVKAQSSDVDNTKIIQDKAFRDEVARIDAFLKAKTKAQQRWHVLQVSALENRPKPNPTPPPSESPSPSLRSPPHPIPFLPREAIASNAHSPFLPTSPGIGASVTSPTNAQKLLPPGNAVALLPPHHGAPTSQSDVGYGIGESMPIANLNPGSVAISNSAQPEAEPEQGLIDRGSSPISPNRDPTRPAMPVVHSGPKSGVTNNAANSANGSENGVRGDFLPESSNRKEKSSASKMSTASREKEKIEDWLSIEAWLYKDSITRELRYSESHILNLLNDTSRQSSKQWLETLASLTSEEHAGIDEAIDARMPNDTRKLLSVHVHSARGASVFRFFLRLCSLGLLDSDHLETRSLLIIIGNKDSLHLNGIPDRYEHASQSGSEIDALEPPPPPRPRRAEFRLSISRDPEPAVADAAPQRVAAAHPPREPAKKTAKARKSATSVRTTLDSGRDRLVPYPSAARPFMRPARAIEEIMTDSEGSVVDEMQSGTKEGAARKGSRGQTPHTTAYLDIAGDRRQIYLNETNGQIRITPRQSERENREKEHAESLAAQAAPYQQVEAEKKAVAKMKAEAEKAEAEMESVVEKRMKVERAEKSLVEPESAERGASIHKQERPMLRDRPQSFHAGFQPMPIPPPFYQGSNPTYYGYPPPPVPMHASPFSEPILSRSSIPPHRASAQYIPAVGDEVRPEQGQSSKKKGQKQTQRKNKGKRAQPEQDASQLRPQRRMSAESITSVESTINGVVAEDDLDEERIRKLFAKWTPDGDQANDSDVEVRVLNSAPEKPSETPDLNELRDVVSKQRADSDDLRRKWKTLASGISSRRDMSSAVAEERSEPSKEDVERSTLREISPMAASDKGRVDVSKPRESRNEARIQSLKGSPVRASEREKRKVSDSKAPGDDGDAEI